MNHLLVKLFSAAAVISALRVTQIILTDTLFELEFLFNDTSTVVGQFVSSPREREKWDRKASTEEEREK